MPPSPPDGPVCHYCAQPLDPAAAGVFQWQCGWVEQRNEGGGHALALARRTSRWACKVCIGMLRSGLHPGQGALELEL